MKRILLGTLILAMLQLAALGAEEKTEKKAAFKDQKSTVSYGIGMNIGTNLKRNGYDVDVDLLAEAIRDVLSGKETKLNEKEVREALTAFTQEMAAKRQQERLELSQKNRKAGEAFLAEKKKEGVKAHSVTLPNGKTEELLYKVVQEGTGPRPNTNDIVSVNYRGTLIDGTEFDNSAPKGGPAEIPITRVIKGWTEALLMMKTGSKWQLFIPADLAYGDAGFAPKIEPGATLVFDVELVSTKAPAPLPPSQPLTSDIIKVPSADELKKGAKIEVIKPEEVEKKIKESQQEQKKK
jgi:FKBP-type peptidyl-prolyl cis-trans isomerase FklB